MASEVRGDQSPSAVVSRTPTPEPDGIIGVVYNNWKTVMAKQGIDPKALSSQCFQTINILMASKATELAQNVFDEAEKNKAWLPADRNKAYGLLHPEKS